jgi:DnaD/phage-associated family protein
MIGLEPFLEISRWGYIQLPVMLYCYATELDMDLEDMGILGAVFYAYQNRSKPLYKTGVEVGQVMQVCPALSKVRLARRLSKWEKQGLIRIEGAGNLEFTARKLYLEPLYQRLRDIVIRDHPEFMSEAAADIDVIKEYEKRIVDLEDSLHQERLSKVINGGDQYTTGSKEFKKVADFISQRTGNLISIKMANELRRWMAEMGFKTEFILCMLELCFERKIVHPREISQIASGLKECSINSLEAMETYFRNFVDVKSRPAYSGFDPEAADFGSFTGIDMNAEARKNQYHKWRYDWGFSPELIKKAGAIMCSRTKSGGLEYVDSVLSNWKDQGLTTVAEVEEENAKHRARRKNGSKGTNQVSKLPAGEEREIYIPPSMAVDSKNKV